MRTLTQPPRSKQSLKKINKVGKQNALRLFKEASVRIPAYKDFLKQNNFDTTKVRSFDDWNLIPVTNKENYVNYYSLGSRCWDGNLSSSAVISTSSGTTGNQIYWPRDLEQDYIGADIHFNLLENIFHVKEKKTLFLDVFSLGTWIAGMYTYTCVYLAKTKGLPITIMTPGLSIEDAVKIITELGDNFEQIIIAGHPPTLKTIAEKISVHENHAKIISFIGAAEGVSRQWREYVANLLKVDELRFINIYGSADAGLMGFQTPFSLSVLENYFTSNNINLPWSSERPTYVYQYDPRFKYIETVEDKISLTVNQTAPLIRYDIHDIGYYLNEHETEKLLKTNPHFKKHWSYSVIAMAGRAGNVATIYAVNVYPENIKLALEHHEYQSIVSGKFILKTEYTESHEQYLMLRIELNERTIANDELHHQIKKHIINHLIAVNAEYAKLASIFGEKVHPQIHLHDNGHPEYFPISKTIKSS